MPIPAGTAIDIRTDVEGPYNGCTWTDASGTYGQALSGTDWWVFESDLGNSGYLYMAEDDDNPATVAPSATVFVCWEVAKWPGSSTADVAACINVNPSGAFPAFNLSTASPSLITVSGSNTANVGIRYDGGGQWTVWEKKPPNTFGLYTHLCDVGGNRAGSAGGNILPAGAGLMYGACWYETAGGNSQPTAFSSTYDEDVSDSVTSADSVLDMVVFSEDVTEDSAAASDVVQDSVAGEAYEKGSIEFNASGGYVRNDANIPADTGTMSFCGWAKMLADRNAESCIVYMPRYSAGVTDFALRTDSDGTSLKINANYGSNQSAAHTLVANEWVFLAVSVSADTATFYTASEGDTALTTVGSVGITGFVPERMILGENEAGQWFDGRLCMWRFWDQALSESELLAEFQSRELVETTDALLDYPMTGGSIANALDDALAGDNDLTEYGSSITFSTDAPAFTFSEDVNESSTATDQLAAVSALFENLSESESASDAVTDLVSVQEDVAESETAADAHSDEITAAEAVGESGTADDAVSGGIVSADDISETLSAADSVAPGTTAQASVSESGTASDSVSGTGGTPTPAPSPAPAPHAAPTGRRIPLVHMTYRGRSYVGPADQVQRAVETQARLDAEQEETPKNKRGTRARAYQLAETLPVSITRVEMSGLPVQGNDPELLRVVEEELRRAYQLSMRTALNDAMAVAEARARRAIIEQNNVIAMAAAERLLLG